jgi:hypothetical protein
MTHMRERERDHEGEKRMGGSFKILGLINHKSLFKLYLCSVGLIKTPNLYTTHLILQRLIN